MRALAIFVVGAAIPLFVLDHLGAPRLLLFAVAAAAALAIPALFARICRFEARNP